MLEHFAEFVASYACALFTGCALYVTIVEHPARMECGSELAATQWIPSYKRAAAFQAPAAVITILFSIISWYFGSGAKWLIVAFAFCFIFLFTLIVIMPVNRKLFDVKKDSKPEETKGLLIKWGNLHVVRTITSLLALFLVLYF